MFSSDEFEGVLLAIADHDEQSAEVDVGTREHDVDRDCAPIEVISVNAGGVYTDSVISTSALTFQIFSSTSCNDRRIAVAAHAQKVYAPSTRSRCGESPRRCRAQVLPLYSSANPRLQARRDQTSGGWDETRSFLLYGRVIRRT